MSFRFSKYQIFIVALLLICQSCKSDEAIDLFVGTYTQREGHVDGKAEGVYVLQFDQKTGKLEMQSTIKGITNPSYLTVHNGLIYAASEIGSSDKGGKVFVFRPEGDDWIKFQELDSGGNWPCHLSIDVDQQKLHVANYSGTTSHFDVLPNGKLAPLNSIALTSKVSKHPRQDGPHAHMVKTHNDNIFIADLGGNDVKMFANESGNQKLIGTIEGYPQSGPRHFDFDGAFIYVLNELTNTIDVFNLKDTPSRVQVISNLKVKPNTGIASASTIKIHPNKKFLYTANRALQGNEANSIQLFHILENNLLEFIDAFDSGGLVPRDFTIDPSGEYCLVANQDSNNIVVYSINKKNGYLTQVGDPFDIPTPVCLVFE